MVLTSRFRLLGPLVIAAAGVTLSLVHTVIYLSLSGGTDATVLTSGTHGYWPAFVLLTLLLAAGAGLRVRQRIARAPLGPASEIALGRLAAGLWVFLLIASVAGFLILENVEAFFGAGRLIGAAPLTLVAMPTALVGVVASVTLVTLVVSILVRERTIPYSATLVGSYRDLVRTGTYAASFTQSEWAYEFVRAVLTQPLEAALRRRGSILECGSGTGIWLGYIASRWANPDIHLHGFDLSPDMVETCRQRLADLDALAEIKVGDILDPDAYRFDDLDRYDVVFAFDVIQQLPRRLQAGAVAAMFEHVAPGGWLVIFDHDRRSRYGRVMGAKKWLRRYFDIPLVPHYYIHARYPDLGSLRSSLERQGAADVSIVVEAEARKRALVARAT